MGSVGSCPLTGPKAPLQCCGWGSTLAPIHCEAVPVKRDEVTLSGLPCHCLGRQGSAALRRCGRLQAPGLLTSGSRGLGRVKA